MNLLSGAGLRHLIGASKYSWRVRRVLSKKAPKYERKDALKTPPFQIENMTDGLISKHIQERYGKPPVKKFDWVKAALRADKLSPDDKKWEEVHKPEYWGLRWADDENNSGPTVLKPVSNGGKGKNWVNSDGIQFPPVKYENYYALRHIGGAPEKEKIRTARGKNEVTRKRVRSDMLFFRADDMPNFEELPEFGQKISREKGDTEIVRVKESEDSFFSKNKRVLKPYTGVVEKKEYNGITLIGTDRVMAKSDKKGKTAPVLENGKEFDGPTTAEVKETEEAAENEMVEPEKPKTKRKIKFVKKKKQEEEDEDSEEEDKTLAGISYSDRRRDYYKEFFPRLVYWIRELKDYNKQVKAGKKDYENDELQKTFGLLFNNKQAALNTENIVAMAKEVAEENMIGMDTQAIEMLEKDKHIDEFVNLAKEVTEVPGASARIREKYQVLL